jgi:IS30 family transposase
MLDTNSTKHKHLTDEERQEIQDCLKHGMTFKDIARRIDKDQTTISKEVKKHITIRAGGGRKSMEDGTPIPPAICPLLVKAPFVCNSCAKYHGSCGHDRHIYLAKKAQESYKETLHTAREGSSLNQEAFWRADEIITDGIRKGQHLYHIIHSHELGLSKSAIYRHLKLGHLGISPLDMPRMVKFKPRSHRKPASVPKALKKGRTHLEFLDYIQTNELRDWVELDTLIGRVGGKTIMTIHFTYCNFMFGFLLEDKTSASVAAAFKALKRLLKDKGLRFGDIFSLILTDNGGEFSDVFAVENDEDGERETRLFFYDPYQPSQKPRIEKNHTLFRDIVPSGSSFDSFTQDTVNLIFSHVNSIKSQSLKGKTPFDMFAFLYGDNLAALLGITPIPPLAVCQASLLLKTIGISL